MSDIFHFIPSSWTVLGLVGCVLIPLCSLKTIDLLKRSSIVGNCAVVYTVGLVFVMRFEEGVQQQLLERPVEVETETSPFFAVDISPRMLQGFSLLICVWNFHFNMPTYYASLRQQHRGAMLRIVFCVYATVVVEFRISRNRRTRPS